MRATSVSPMESRVPRHHIPGLASSLLAPHPPLLDTRVPYGRLQHPLTIYPIDQMKSSHVENDYIDSPAVVSHQPPSSHKTAAHHHHHQRGSNVEPLLGGMPPPAHHHHHHLGRCEPPGPPQRHDATTHPWISFSGRPSSISSSSSTSSDQRLLDHAAPTPTVDPHHHHHHGHGGANTPAAVVTRTPPPPCFEPKVLTSASKPLLDPLKVSGAATTAAATTRAGVVPGSGAALGGEKAPKHLLLCEACGKCRCTECTLPRTLPSCWVCNQECLCSVQSLVDAATCMCLVKGVFYHCAEDEDGDEGSCADRPCSCQPSNRCARWSFMAALSLVLPCLVCYLPAAGCAKLSQRCYDTARRPGCRCRTSPASSSLSSSSSQGKGVNGEGRPGQGQGGPPQEKQAS